MPWEGWRKCGLLCLGWNILGGCSADISEQSLNTQCFESFFISTYRIKSNNYPSLSWWSSQLHMCVSLHNKARWIFERYDQEKRLKRQVAAEHGAYQYLHIGLAYRNWSVCKSNRQQLSAQCAVQAIQHTNDLLPLQTVTALVGTYQTAAWHHAHEV